MFLKQKAHALVEVLRTYFEHRWVCCAEYVMEQADWMCTRPQPNVLRSCVRLPTLYGVIANGRICLREVQLPDKAELVLYLTSVPIITVAT